MYHVFIMITDIAGFLFCTALITYSGTQLSKYGNRLAELTGLSKAWIGLILLATVTSLPELITGISAVAVLKAPNLAAGNVLGSCAFNLLILSVLDVMVKKPITSMVKASHLVTGSFGIILLCTAAGAILFKHEVPVLLWFSPITVLILAIYFTAMRSIFLHENANPPGVNKRTDAAGNKKALLHAISIYSMQAAIVILSALFLPYFGEHIAQKTGMGNSFFGTLFLAITTSLPELVISISALRIGAVDMAIGNLLGSNVFNIFVLAINDLFYAEGSLYTAISETHLLSILTSVIMTAVVAIGLTIRPEKKRWYLGQDTFIILILYIGLMVTFFFRT